MSSQQDKYSDVRKRFPLFADADRCLERIRHDDELLGTVIAKFNELDPFRGRYAKAFLNEEGIPEYKTVPYYQESKNNPWVKYLDDNVAAQHFLGENLALAVDFTYHTKLKRQFTGRSDADTRFIILDLDIPEFDVCERVAMRLYEILTNELGIPCYLSFSGGKGVHIEIFLDEKVPSGVSDDFHKYLMSQYRLEDMYSHLIAPYKALGTAVDIEVRPQKWAGNAAKMSLGVHAKSRMFCGYLEIVNDRLVEVQDSHQYYLDTKFDAPAAKLREISALYRSNLVSMAEKKAIRAVGRPKSDRKRPVLKSRPAKKMHCLDQQELLRRLQLTSDSFVNDLELDTWQGVQRKVDLLMRDGLLPGLKRHDTTLFFLRYLRLHYTASEAIAIAQRWSRDVLYPNCGSAIDMDIESHLVWIERAVANLWIKPVRPLESTFKISENEFKSLVGYAQKPTTYGSTVDLPMLTILLALYLYGTSYKGDLLKGTHIQDSDDSEPGNGWFSVAYEYIHFRTGMAPASIHRVIQSLKARGVLKVKRRRKLTEHGWDVSMNRYRFVASIQDGGRQHYLDFADLWRRNLASVLLREFYSRDELIKLLGGYHNWRKVNRVLGVAG